MIEFNPNRHEKAQYGSANNYTSWKKKQKQG